LRNLILVGVAVGVLAAVLFVATNYDFAAPSIDWIKVSSMAEDGRALTHNTIRVAFSELVQTKTAESNFSIDPGVKGSFSWEKNVMTFKPDADARLALNTTYKVVIKAGVKDLAGNALKSDFRWSFTTVAAPTVVSSKPGPYVGDVPIDSNISLVFSTEMDLASLEKNIEVQPTKPKWTLSLAKKNLILQPSEPLSFNTVYSLTIKQAASDLDGNSLAEDYHLVFTTVEEGLHIKTVVPASGAKGISVHTPLAVVFDQEVDESSYLANLSVAEAVSKQPVHGQWELSSSPPTAGRKNMLVFYPDMPLASNTTYTATLKSGLRSKTGTYFAPDFSWSFTSSQGSNLIHNQILFYSDRSGAKNVWTMNTDGSNQHQVTYLPTDIDGYSFSPDGSAIVYSDGSDLVMMNVDGSNRRTLTPAGEGLEIDPAWSPDGSRIAFARILKTGENDGIWLTNADGSDRQRIVAPSDLPRAGFCGRPVWSPNGEWLAFYLGDSLGGGEFLWQIAEKKLTSFDVASSGEAVWLATDRLMVSGRVEARANSSPCLWLLGTGGSVEKFTQVSAEDLRGRGSPVDSSVVYASRPSSSDPSSLWILEGGSRRQLTTDKAFDDDWPYWSPTAQWIVFARGRFEAGKTTTWRSEGIWLIDREGINLKQLTVDGTEPIWVP